MMALKLERIYTQPADLDGYRILVDRLWPRGMSKEKASQSPKRARAEPASPSSLRTALAASAVT